jgi:hypothetical protein
MLLFGKQLVCCHENTQKSVTLVWSKMHRVFSLLVAQLWPWKRLDMILLRKCSFSFDKNHASCIANCASHSVYDGELPSSETYLFKIPHLLYDLVHVLYKLLNCLRRMDSLTLHDSSGILNDLFEGVCYMRPIPVGVRLLTKHRTNTTHQNGLDESFP